MLARSPSQALHSSEWQEDKREWTQTGKRELLTWHEENLIHHEDCQALERVAQRSCQCPAFEVFRTQEDKPQATYSDLIAHPTTFSR